MAIQSLTNAIHDRDAVFYIKEKNPGSIDEVCELFEKFRVLTGGSHTSKPTAVKGVKPEEDKPQMDLLSSLIKHSEHTNQQVAQLTETVGRLLLQQQQQPPQQAARPTSQPSSALSQSLQRGYPAPDYSQPPRTPCPACKQHGHWRRDCPTLRHQGNYTGPVPAPGTRSAAPPRSQ